MLTVASFEAGTISDAIKKAARVAPTKVGSAFDKAAGIIFDVYPGTDAPCVVRATNTDIFYVETVDVVNAEGDAVRWRLPSQVMANIIGNMPTTAGKVVTFTQKDSNVVEIASGRMRLKLVLNLNPYYPEWDITDPEDLVVASNFGGNITRVEWAASKNGPSPLDGVHISGTHIIATDRYRIARVPCEIDLPSGPITIPAWSIGQLLKQMGDVSIGVDGSLFVAQPDSYTQIKTTILGAQYMPIDRVTSMQFEEQVEINRSHLLSCIQNASQMAGADRAPVLTVIVGKEEFAVTMNNQEIGLFGDVVEIDGQATHPRVQIRFTPRMLIDALNNAPNDKITFKYNPSNINLPIGLDGDSGYEAWIAPRSEKTPTQ